MSYPPGLSSASQPASASGAASGLTAEAGPSRINSPYHHVEARVGHEESVDLSMSDGRESEVELSQIQRYEDFSTVDWVQDSLRERYAQVVAPPSPTSFKGRLTKLDGPFGYVGRAIVSILEEGETWVVISLVGVAIGATMAIISITSVWLSDIKMGYCSTGWWLNRKFCCLEVSEEGELCEEWTTWGGMEPFRYIAYIIYAALFSFSAAYLVRGFAPYAAGSGISEIKCILGGFIIKGFLSFATTAIKAITLPLTIASGLSVGKEGPSVHYACGIGHVVGGWFQRYRQSASKMRDIVTSASAAGVAVAFGSPIGGVLFSIEEMNQAFSVKTMWQSFVCALVATFTLASMDPFRTGKLVLFQVSYDRDWHYFEIPAYLLIGLFGGLYGVFVIKFNLQVVSFRKKNLKEHGVSEAVFLASLTAVIGYLNRFLRIDMTECMEMLFKECEGGGDRDGLCQTSEQWKMVNSLFLAVLIRVALVIISYGAKVPCGIFVPSMAIGAMFGRMVGILMKALHTAAPNAPWFDVCPNDAPCITPGTYAFLGAAACLSGVTRLTVTVVVIMFELTGALTYILPVMIVLLVTKGVGDSFDAHGIADTMIKFNGYPFLEKEDKSSGDRGLIEPIGHVMKRSMHVMRADGMPLGEIEEIVQSTSYQGFPVVRGEFDKTIVGMVNKTELRYALEKARRTRNIIETAKCTFNHLPSSIDTLDGEGRLAQPDIVIPYDVGKQRTPAHSPMLGRDRDRERDMSRRRSSGIVVDHVDFGMYVDETPITVSPKMPLEVVMQLFRRLGPRVILVATEGLLVGLVTVKDVLRHEAQMEHAHAHAHARGLGTSSPSGPGRNSTNSPVSRTLFAAGGDMGPAAPSPGRGRRSREGDGGGGYGVEDVDDGWADSWETTDTPRMPSSSGIGTGTGAGTVSSNKQRQSGHAGESGKGLEIALEEGFKWVNERAEGWKRKVSSGVGLGGPRGDGADGVTENRNNGREAMEYELEEGQLNLEERDKDRH